jgi:lipopolysaccharide O-acetyltransferase
MIVKYNIGIREIMKSGVYLIYTKLFFRKSRIVRYPIDIRGRGNIDFGRGLTTGKYNRIEAFTTKKKKILKFGKGVQMNDFNHITAIKSVTIGDNVLMASKIYISDSSHGNYSGTDSDAPESIVNERQLSARPVKIGDNVWLGESVAILPGITIGKNSIIGAGSVVTKDVPENCIAVGNPASVVKKWNEKEQKWQKVAKK